MDLVFCRFGLLENMDTQSNLVLARRATVERILAAAEVATVGEIHAVLVAVSVPHDRANLAVRPKGKSDAQGPVS
jgi:hypothetical protein